MESDRSPSSDYQKFWSEVMNSVPHALTPVYKTDEPNQPIVLYEGALQFTQKTNQQPVKMQGQGCVKYAWFPFACIKFEFSNHNQDFQIDVNNRFATLTLSSLATSVEVLLEKINYKNGNNSVSGRVEKPIVKGAGQDLVYVLFHVANFHNFIGSCNTIRVQDSTKQLSRNRVTFKVESWKLTLDQLEDIKKLSSY